MVSPSTYKSLATIVLIIFCTIPIALSFYIEHRRNVDVLPIGQRVFPFKTTFVGGGTFVFDSSSTRKLLLLFYSTSCAHCRNEIVNLDSLYKSYSDRLNVVGICVDSFPNSVARKEDLRLSFPIVFDNGMELARKFKIAGIPTVYCIDESRVLRYRSSGEHSFLSDAQLVADFVALR